MRAAKNGGLTILIATVLCREGKLHRAEQAIGAEVTLYLRSRQSVFDQVASKALSTGWLHAWSVLLPQTSLTRRPCPASISSQSTATWPCAVLRAPYLAAFVANSWIRSPNGVAASLDRVTAGPFRRTRGPAAVRYGSSCSRATPSRSAPIHSPLIN